ncbi:hypothetical protein AWB81_04206 [Caballeronia arationis]|nr:hypothetical protein AWB81_04206 [Caballeronia arationis]
MHYERVQRFGFKPLKSDQYYAASELDAAFDGPMTSPTVTALPSVAQAKQPDTAPEGRTFKWKGLPTLDESDLQDTPNEEPSASDMEVAIEHLSASCMKISDALKTANLNDQQAVALIEVLVGGALRLAALTGHVLTVETRPKAKFAMGSYDTVVDIRESNKVYRERYRREAEAKEAIRQSSAGPVVLGHPVPEHVPSRKRTGVYAAKVDIMPIMSNYRRPVVGNRARYVVLLVAPGRPSARGRQRKGTLAD